MNDVNYLYELWKENAVNDSDLIEELKAIEGKEDEILDRFYRNLEFGTAGLRGVIGAGTNRMNIYTVNQATQGLADFLNANYENPKVAIAYDSRIKSDLFSREAAGVLAANGIKVFYYPELMPTPMLSFAVRRLNCQSGIIITASHNPSKYNGYKCYDPNGYQMTDEAAQKTYEYIQKVDLFQGVKRMDFEEALAQDMVDYIEDWLIEEYYSLVLKQAQNPQICAQSGLHVIYTPLNGAGNKPVREILKRAGLKNISVVAEQEKPDGNFPTCPYPNPEIRQAFECALKMTETIKADLLLATDPDCDRVGIAVLDKGEYRLMSGNEVGALLTEYLLSCRKAAGNLPENPIVVKSFVTTDLVAEIAKSYGCEVFDLLTGFKYIGELITELEKKGEEHRFIIGMEESYGYLAGTHARDKDAVVASMLICEMAAYYKLQGKNLAEVMDELYQKYGAYINSLLNFTFEGAQGMQKMSAIMEDLRKNTPTEIGGMKVLVASDYETSRSIHMENKTESKILLPKSNAVAYKLENCNGVIIRPSGTEPKIKVYLTACAATKEKAQARTECLGNAVKKIIKID